MKKVNALLLGTGIALATAIAAPSFAKPHHHGGEKGSHHHGERHSQHRGEKRLERMLAKVNATDEQKQVIAAILAAEKPTKEALKNRRKALRDQTKALDPMSGDYNGRVAELAEEKAAIARDSFVQRANVKQQIALQLTPEQRAQLAEMKAKRQQKRAELASMTKEERMAFRAERKAERKAAREARRADID